MAMEGTINIAGKPVKKSLLAGLALGVIVLGGVVYVRNKKNAASAATTAAPITDPATGYQQGSPEDLAALSQLQAAYQGAGYPGGAGGGGSISTPPGSGTGFTSNAAWAQAAEDYIVNTAQGSASVVGNALGKYLTGQGMTPDQMNIANQAIAFEGYPPVPGPNGFPPAMNELPVPGPKPPPPKPVTVKVPAVIGLTELAASQKIAAAGLHPHGAPIKPGTTGFKVAHQNPAAGKTVAKGSTVSIS